MRQQLLKESVKKAGGGETPGTPVPARVKVRWSKSDSSPYTRSVLKNLSLVSRLYSFTQLIKGETGKLIKGETGNFTFHFVWFFFAKYKSRFKK
jgi:hypothetical protein